MAHRCAVRVHGAIIRISTPALLGPYTKPQEFRLPNCAHETPPAHRGTVTLSTLPCRLLLFAQSSVKKSSFPWKGTAPFCYRP